MAGTRVPRQGCLFPAQGWYAWVKAGQEADGGALGGGGGGVGLRGEAARRSGAASEVAVWACGVAAAARAAATAPGLRLFMYIFCSLIPLTLFFCFYYEYCLMNLKLSTCVHTLMGQGVPEVAESHSPAGLKVAWGEGIMRAARDDGSMQHGTEATDTNAKHRNQGACDTQSKRKCKWNRVPCRAGVDEWRCGCRCVVQDHAACWR